MGVHSHAERGHLGAGGESRRTGRGLHMFGALGFALFSWASLVAGLSVALAAPQQAAPSAEAPQAASQPTTAQEPTEQLPQVSSSNPQPPENTPPSPTGVIAFEQIQFAATNLGTVIIEDTDLGFGITEHLAADVGLPIIFTRSPFSPVVKRDFYTETLLGEPYLDVRYSGTFRGARYTTILTATFPVTNQNRIYTTGRVGGDWFNHVETAIGGLTPFVNFGVSNGAKNRFIMPRPYSEARPYETLGLMGDVEGGLEYKFGRFAKGLGIGGSYYALLPVGPQKVFSRLVVPYSSLAGDASHYRYFYSAFETTGGHLLSNQPSVKGISAIARDNGYSGWLHVFRGHNVDLQFAYTRSARYRLDMYSVTITFDGSSLFRSLTGH